MSHFDLAALTRRARNPRKRQIELREIVPTNALATDLFAIYRPVITTWTEALPRILAAYERTLTEREGIRDSVSDIQSSLDFAKSEINRLLLVLTPSLRRWALSVEKWHRGKWIANTLAATGVSLDTLIGPEDVAEPVSAVIARNAALVRDVSAQTENRIADIVFRAFTARTPARDVAKEMSEAVGMGRKRALRIASDQTTKLASELDGERMRQAGIEAWLWRSSHKQNFRPEHQARDGKRYTWSDAPNDLPGQLPFCGCRKQALVSFD